MRHARGEFNVKIRPLPLEGLESETTLGRMSIEKEYHGDLEASGRGQMLTALTPIADSRAYVAIERVSGTLEGREGHFTLQHRGTMNHGEQDLAVTVVPDSATGELAGLTGTLKIEIADEKHSYDLEYFLPPLP